MIDRSAPRGVNAAAADGVRQVRHTCSPDTSYPTRRRKVNRHPRAHYPNLSPTRPPVTPSDVALWPDWTKSSVEDLDLDQFGDDGFPLFEGGC